MPRFTTWKAFFPSSLSELLRHSSSWRVKHYRCEEKDPLVTKCNSSSKRWCFTCCVIWFVCHCWVIVVVADGMVPIWQRDISNNYDDVGLVMCIRSAPTNCQSLAHICVRKLDHSWFKWWHDTSLPQSNAYMMLSLVIPNRVMSKNNYFQKMS